MSVTEVISQKDISEFREIRDFEVLFKLHYRNLCAYAYLFLKDADTSEDTVQEVFFKLWKSKEKISIETSLKSYLFRSVRNGCLNVIEHLKVRDGYNERQTKGYESEQQPIIDPAIVNELEQKIKESIYKLPPERRKIFMMSRYEGLKYREIAEELSISVKTVENQMCQALSFLREHLKEYLPLVLWLFFFRNGK